MNTINELVQKQYDIVPVAVQDAIDSPVVAKHITDIGVQHAIPRENMGKLEDAVLMLLLGFYTLNEFIPEVSSTLNIQRDKAESIAKSVDAKILSPIRVPMQMLQQLLAEAEKRSPPSSKESVRPEIATPVAQNNAKLPPIPPPAPKLPPKMEISTIPKIETPAFQAPQPPQQSGPIPNLRTMPRDVARLKLEESVRLPKEEISLRYKSEESQHATPKKPGSPTEGKTQGAGDPYRELPQ